MLTGRSRIGFTEKRVSKNAFFSVALGAGLLIVHGVMMILSIGYEGKLPLAGGVVESYLLLLGIFGVFWAMLSFDEEKTIGKFKVLGVILNILGIALSIFVMAIGFMTYDI